MSEERRALPIPVDESAEPSVASAGPATRDAGAARRRLALRIPDDEVARPQGVPTAAAPALRDAAPGARPAAAAGPMAAAAPPAAAGPVAAAAPPAAAGPVAAAAPPTAPAAVVGARPPLESGPDTVAGRSPAVPRADAAPRPSVALPRPDGLPQGAEDASPLTPMRIITISEPPPPVSEVALDGTPLEVDGPPTPRAKLALEIDHDADGADSDQSEEVDVRFEEDPPTPRTPQAAWAAAAMGADAADSPGEPATAVANTPSEAPDEVAAEDVVTVEPPPAAPVPVIGMMSAVPPMRPRLASQPPIPPPQASKRPVPAAVPPRLVIVPPHVGNVSAVSQEPGTGAQRRKGRLWWEELFNDDYVRTSEKISDPQIGREVTFVEESLGVERGGAILDLACGTGRHAVELARRGYEVVGFDLSLPMLARASEEAQDRAAKLNFVQGDMREMTFEEQFDGIYSWNTSFGYFEEDKNAQVIDRIHRALKGGGMFLLDVINRDFLIRQSPSLAWFEADGCVCMDEMNIDFITSRMKVKRTMMLDDGRSREIEYSMRVYSLHELGRMLHEHAFKVREVSGRLATPGVFFGNESPRIMVLAEKR